MDIAYRMRKEEFDVILSGGNEHGTLLDHIYYQHSDRESAAAKQQNIHLFCRNIKNVEKNEKSTGQKFKVVI